MDDYSVADLFSEKNMLQTYLLIEGALAQAQADIGLIPSEAATEIRLRATLENLDVARLRAQTERTGYVVAPLVRQLTEVCGESGHFVHWGATTQDVINTGLAIQLNAVFRKVDQYLRQISDVLVLQVQSHRHSVMAARTFGGHALPITFSFKVAVWLSSILRHMQRVKHLIRHPMAGEFSGVAGTLASLGDRGLAVRKRLM